MRCIHHSTQHAVAICCNCGRALCQNCLRFSSEQETVCSQDCADRCATRSAVREAWYREITIKARGYRCLAVVFRLLGGFCFLLTLGIGISELQEAPFNRVPLPATIAFITVLLGLSMASAIGARGLDRQNRESQRLLMDRRGSGAVDNYEDAGSDAESSCWSVGTPGLGPGGADDSCICRR